MSAMGGDGGGDDLCDDEMYLNVNNLDDDDSSSSSSVKEGRLNNTDGGNKRKYTHTYTTHVKDEEEAAFAVDIVNKSKRNKRKKMQSMRGIVREDRVMQAEYLWSCYQNALTTDANDDLSLVAKSDGELSKSSFMSSRICVFEGEMASSDHRSNDSNIAVNYRSLLSAKKLMKKVKKHKSHSPLMLIVCVSARRCVSVLKGLAPLKIRCGKLFAKHMNVKQQIEMLEKETYSIVVGTPNRLLRLCDEGALKFLDTEIVIFDGAEINGYQNVCTLNDTRGDVASLLKKHISPQLKNICLGMY